MTTIPQLMEEIRELERDVLYYKNRYERIRDERNKIKNKFNEHINNSEKIDKAISIYLKELSEKGKVDDLACKMFNTLEGNI